MVLISKNDKKIWEEYVSNFSKFVVFPQNNALKNPKTDYKKQAINKNNKSKSYSKLFKKRRFKPDSVLDLHGYSLYSARSILNKYIINCYEKKMRHILIITGKGQNNKGVLKEKLPILLSDKSLNKYLIDFDVAPKHFGGEGALLIRIRNKLKNLNL